MYGTLIERLEKATGPRLELDGMIWCAINGYRFVGWDGAGCVYKTPQNDGIHHAEAHRVKPYSASLDAATGLVERMLPDWERGVWWNNCQGHYAELRDNASSESSQISVSSTGATGAIALVCALLKALEAREGE